MGSAAQSIVSKLGQLLVDEVQDIRGVGDKVDHLMDELSTMNAALRMISEADQSSVDHLMREWEKQVRELAYDAEDCTDTYWLRIHRPIPLLRHIVTWRMYQLEKLMVQCALAADVKALLARTTAVSERRVRYGIDRAALPRSPWFAPVSGVSVSANALRRAANDPDGQFVGIRKQADTLAERIKAEDDDKRLKVFSIVGFGGLGKTTLAVKLCRQLDADFQRQALVSVSQAFDGGKDMKGLLARLLKQIVKVKEGHEQPNNEGAGTSTTTAQGNQLVKLGKQIDEMDVATLSSYLEEQLTGKRYLIMIDDVWSQPAWEAISIKLPENNCSSRIIVTTRIETVAKASSVSDDLVHRMKALKPDDSKKLFIKRVFGSTCTCPDGLDGIMINILKKCGGMPLAVVSIASLLASHSSPESVQMWIKVSDSIGSQMETHPTLEGMSQVVALSYDYLPHHLKACMMYLSIFPEDYVIAKDRLLCRWIAEGLVAEKQGLTLFDVAEEYFNELLGRNMIQPDKLTTTHKFWIALDDETMEACRVHDMMLEFMVSKSRDANFVRLVGRQYGEGLSGGKIRRLSVHGNDDKKKMEQRHRARQGIETMNLQQVRPLTIFRAEGVERLLDRLGEFKLLRVLDLEDCKALQDKHMRYVCRLYLLRFLRLASTGISAIPREIGDLEYLETLDVKRKYIGEMPPTVTKLSKLERLRVQVWILTRGIGNMKALRELDFAVLKGDVQVAREIGELQQLQMLLLRVAKVGPEEKLLRALGSSLSKTRALRSLELTSSETLDFLLHVSSPPPLLRRLTMSGPICRFPDWISSLKHLTEFSVLEAKLAGDQVLDSLCKLPSLQRIQLGYNSCGEQELVARTTHNFLALRILKLDLREDHPEVVKFEQGSMTKLKTLLLEFSYRDKSIVGIDNLENLRKVKLKGYKNNPLECQVEQNLESLREVLLKRAVEQNLENRREDLLKCSEQNLEDLRDVLCERRVERNSGNLREVPLESAVLDNVIREVMFKGNENKSLERVLKQLEDINKERPEKTNHIKVVVVYR